MTNHRGTIGDPLGIPVHIDPNLPAGTAELDISDDSLITGIRAGSRAFTLTTEQIHRLRIHYAVVNLRAALLAELWEEFLADLAREQAARARCLAMLPPVLDPMAAFRITGL